MDRLGTVFEIKQVEQRIISGHAAAWSLDRVGDVIDPTAFQKTLSEKQPSDIAVFVGHNTQDLPIGVPIKIEPDAHGLYTEVQVFDGPRGDDLLAAAKGLRAAGRTLGLSIGYRVRDSKHERIDGKTVRRLMDIDLVEFSYAASQTIANPAALMTGVKQITDDDTTPEKGAPMELPNSAYLYVEDGDDDAEGLRVPRTKRHFAYRDAEGKIDPEALEKSIAGLTHASLTHGAYGLEAHDTARLGARARRMLELGEKAEELDAAEWKTAAPALDLLAVAYRLIDTATHIVDEHTALAALGDDTKQGRLVRAETRQSITDTANKLTRVVDSAQIVAQGQEEKASADYWRAYVDMTEVTV